MSFLVYAHGSIQKGIQGHGSFRSVGIYNVLPKRRFILCSITCRIRGIEQDTHKQGMQSLRTF